MNQYFQFRVQWGGSGAFVAKKSLTRLRGTNICTSSARFAPSFVWQPNSPKCTQIVRNISKRQFRVKGVDRVRSLRKIPMRLRGTNFCTSSARFAPSFVRLPNSPLQIVQNIPKRQFRIQQGGSGAFVAKNSDATSWHELLHQFGPFCLEFRKTNKRSQIHPNSMKRTKTSDQSPMGWIGCVRCEKFRRNFVAQTFALVRPVLHRFLLGNQTV